MKDIRTSLISTYQR